MFETQVPRGLNRMNLGCNLVMQLSVEDEVMAEWRLMLLTVLVKSR